MYIAMIMMEMYSKTMMTSTGQTALQIVLDNMSPDQQMLDLLLRHGASPKAYNPDKDGQCRNHVSGPNKHREMSSTYAQLMSSSC